MDSAPVQQVLENARDRLLSERVAAGHWEGKLSTSALSTATAVIALHVVDPDTHANTIEDGISWLVKNQNKDGGWGDTVESFSNISTTLLCRAALNRWRRAVAKGESGEPGRGKLLKRTDKRLNRSASWLRQNVNGESIEATVDAVKARYGKDRTFSVPILMACALGGLLDKDPKDAWQRVLPLPFELAALPQKWFAILRMPVVSYALPALIAIGYARFHHAPPRSFLRRLRRSAWPRASKKLREIQPENGGYLEATPLTSFVTMALAGSDQKDHPVVTKGVDFLLDSVRSDGSWPIDTNLATWTTTLAVKALIPAEGNRLAELDTAEHIDRWLLDQQYQEPHPFTAAAPGGWSWTDLPGGVPDADDTPGALLALRRLATPDTFTRSRDAAAAGLIWLCDLQNRDGGIPTFCHGWGTLPFDRSSPDITAHTLCASYAWVEDMTPLTRARVRWMKHRCHHYLKKTRQPDGSWLPLWFGNQHRPGENNPTYGTACVVRALAIYDPHHLLRGALHWFLQWQNSDGGWGAGKDSPSSIEETALAIEAVSTAANGLDLHFDVHQEITGCLEKSFRWLSDATGEGNAFPCSPIGFYFAKLWYSERLYPQVWTVSALEALHTYLTRNQ